MKTSLVVDLWRSFRLFHSSTSGRLKRANPVLIQSLEPGNLLLKAHVTKTLYQSGTQNLDADLIPLSHSLVLHVLKRTSLDPFKKIDFFNWCADKHGYKHSAETYSEIFRVLCRSRSRNHLNDHVVDN